MVDNSECHSIILTEERLKTSKMKCVFFFIFLIQGIVFWPEKSKSDVYFCQPEPEILDNPEKQAFTKYQGFQN